MGIAVLNWMVEEVFIEKVPTEQRLEGSDHRVEI